METNHPTSSHYREHTRQQDGWTVLVPPTPSAAPELPPPYTPEDNSIPAAPALPPGPTLLFQIPTNSNIIGAAPVTKTKKWAGDVPFAVALPEICRIMGLDPMRARIGYKWDNDKVSAPVQQLSNAADWVNCLAHGIKMQSKARTRTVICMVKNLVRVTLPSSLMLIASPQNLPEETAPTTSSAAATGSTAKKRKAPANSPDDGKKTFDFTQEYRLLKKHLDCATHKGLLCYVANGGHHIEVDREHASLWAKEIVCGHLLIFLILTLLETIGNASLQRPPENIMFQEYFLPAPKRSRTTRSSPSTNPCAPTINVTVNTGKSADNSHASPSPPRPRRSPLSTITAATANLNNIDIPSSLYRGQPEPEMHASGFDDVRYPSVIDVLQKIDNSVKRCT
ncbi:hypothetical protein B0H15DRAFT_946270 [Mycena belliarum]|uniref:Uncharacterized protein n=1 Tax=Mycena belliarum TaxID=1033014 RepID=A0AAD6XU12_9AGAR|nr:hypothetical protein B0H15DRAFT_946270 [Mycena belliae]